MNTIVTTNEPTYVLVPEFTAKPQFFKFLVVLTGFLIMMVGYVYAANYNNEYTPNFSMLIDFLIDNNAVSHSRFKNYITDIGKDVKEEVCETFTTLQPENSNTNNSISFFDKIRFYINRFITNTFYVNKNTVRVKVNSTESIK